MDIISEIEILKKSITLHYIMKRVETHDIDIEQMIVFKNI